MVAVRDLVVSRLVELAGRVGYTWDKGAARYRSSETGRFVSERAMLNLSSGMTDYARQNINNLTQRFVDGNITVDVWQQQMARELKDTYLINSMIGRGGRDAMAFADYGRIGGRLQFEYRHLDQFARDIADGKLSNEQIIFRARMYAEGTRTAYFDGKTAAKKEAEFDEERRVLGPAEHCDDCVDYAAEGWVPIGSLPEPGEGSQCMSNCQCEKEYRKSGEE